MGEKQKQPFQLSFNASLKVDLQGSRITSDGGLILVRELDERLGLGDLIAHHLTDSRKGKNTQLPLADLFRQSVYSRIAGYEDVNDAERLSQDPTFRLIGSEKTWDRGAALTSQLQTFETEMLAEDENFGSLARINRELIGKAEVLDSPPRVVLDMDSTEIPVYGQQENSAYSGHFESTCCHPLLLFNREGDCLAAKLRPVNVHSADDWEELLLPEIDRQQRQGKEVVFRARPGGHPAFAKPEIYEALEERGVKYAIRIPANDGLERDIAELLTRPVGRPSHKPVVWYKGSLYRAASWKHGAADRGAASASGVGEGCGSREIGQRAGRGGKVWVESGKRAAVAGHGVLGRSRTTLPGLQGRLSGEKGELQRLQDTAIVVCCCWPQGQKGNCG
jgi:hypothetical protein